MKNKAGPLEVKGTLCHVFITHESHFIHILVVHSRINILL